MDKDEAFKIAVKLLSKLLESDNTNSDILECQAHILKAEADKDYAKVYRVLEELKQFINKLEIALKKDR